MPVIRLARQAMATRFEILLEGEDPVDLRAAGEEALDEIERQESLLSLYRPTSEISRINRFAHEEPVLVSPPVFDLLMDCRRLWEWSDGAFDITVAPLMRAWGFLRGTGRWPERAALEEARRCIGMQHVRLDAERRTVRFERPGMMLDLGAVGKGYAIDEAVVLLREAGVRAAFLHGGTSTCYGLGVPARAPAWKAAITERDLAPARSPGESPSAVGAGDPIETISLRDSSLSVSAVQGKAFEYEGRVYGHVIDPRSGRPVSGARLAAAVGPRAAWTDALSTALLVVGAEGAERLAARAPGMGFLVVRRTGAGEERVWAGESYD
ncbi:MAG: FAD:protein FMN transferase [Verrucomicrobia bacterium]|nr:MAG: FAD:protein FMN transferase [Verrucomicrobiota bacterium]